MTAYDLLIEMMPFFMFPITFATLRFVYNIVRVLMHGCYIEEIAEELKKEEESRTTNIDEDMEKYYNYKE